MIDNIHNIKNEEDEFSESNIERKYKSKDLN